MSQKRFSLKEWEDLNYCEHCFYDGENQLSDSDVVVLLNEQQATIKSKDKQLERLYNYFQDYLKGEMSGNAFSEMWDFVKEDEKWEDE